MSTRKQIAIIVAVLGSTLWPFYFIVEKLLSLPLLPGVQ